MKAVYLTGKAGGGKTATALGLAIKLSREGLKVTYFKPLGYRKGMVKKDDDDVFLMREVLDLPFAGEVICPFTINANYLSARFINTDHGFIPKIKESFEKCTEGFDVVLIDGGIEPYVGTNLGLDDFSLAKLLEAMILPVIRADDDLDLDQNLLYLDLWNERKVPALGALFNNVSPLQINKTKSIYKPLVEAKGYRVLGIIPCQLEISAPTVEEFYDVLSGEILAGADYLDRIVEEIVVGTMTIDSALSYMRKAPNKAVVTGGDRTNMVLTALETSTSAIILTGGFYPDIQVLSRAEEKGVPVILVHEDTFNTLENLQSVYRSIHPQNKTAIDLVEATIDKYVDFEYILNRLKK